MNSFPPPPGVSAPPAYNRPETRHMEYVSQRGAFDDMPLAQITADFQVVYPTLLREHAQMHAASFQQDVERETR